MLDPDKDPELVCRREAGTVASKDEPDPELRRDGSVNILAGGLPTRLFNLAICASLGLSKPPS